jgi:hypothetical protein
MRIKLFENFNNPGFIKITDDVYNDKLKEKNKENWTAEEIARLEKISKKEDYKVVFSKYSRIGRHGNSVVPVNPVPDVSFNCLGITISPLNFANKSPSIKMGSRIFAQSTIVIDKIEDEWYLVTMVPSTRDRFFDSGYFLCDQLSGLEDFLKMIFKK